VKRFFLRKHQILRKQKEISYLFENGKSLVQYPIKAVYCLNKIQDANEKIDRFKILVIVPKKNIKKSSHRNRIKRKIREAFRLHQYTLIVPENHYYSIAFIYLTKSDDEEILNQIYSSIEKILQEISNSDGS
jgi:ribonuclease P protein component